MMAQDWGSQAEAAAAAMGVSATALAATCAMESNCQNVGAASGSSAAGAFQMINSTYTADISGAVAYDPAIAGSIVSGLAGQMDPATEAYAASYELRSDALLLQSRNISDPTVLDVRAVYQFGAGAGPAVATADDSANIAALTGLSAASLAANGLTSSSTVGDWRPPSSQNSARRQQIKPCWPNNLERCYEGRCFRFVHRGVADVQRSPWTAAGSDRVWVSVRWDQYQGLASKPG